MLCILQGRTLRMVTTAGIYMIGLTLTIGHMGSELHITSGFQRDFYRIYVLYAWVGYV